MTPRGVSLNKPSGDGPRSSRANILIFFKFNWENFPFVSLIPMFVIKKAWVTFRLATRWETRLGFFYRLNVFNMYLVIYVHGSGRQGEAPPPPTLTKFSIFTKFFSLRLWEFFELGRLWRLGWEERPLLFPSHHVDPWLRGQIEFQNNIVYKRFTT